MDFDKDSLRASLPRTVGHIARALQAGCCTYVHCTAGLGRAPASCIAYMYWFLDGFDLHRAYDHLTRIRPCGPSKEAIRGATFDLCTSRPMHELASLPPHAFDDMSAEERFSLRARVLQLDTH